MPSILETLSRTFDDGFARQLGDRLGADDGATRTALDAAVPLIVAALARNASAPDGAASLSRALDRDHDGSLLENLGGLLAGGTAIQRDGGKILGHVFGARTPSAESAVAKASGLDTAKVAQLLQFIAPMVLAALAKRRQGAATPDIGDLLGREVGAVRAKAGSSDFLTSLLDADGDGSMLDDIAGRGLGVLKGMLADRNGSRS